MFLKLTTLIFDVSSTIMPTDFLQQRLKTLTTLKLKLFQQILKLTYITRGLRSSSRYGRIIKRTVFGFH